MMDGSFMASTVDVFAMDDDAGETTVEREISLERSL